MTDLLPLILHKATKVLITVKEPLFTHTRNLQWIIPFKRSNLRTI